MRDHDIPASTARGAGERLRQARLEQRRTPDDVAKELRLSPRQIVALEEDDYARLPGATYVRGYLRGYAQLLGLPADELVATYNRLFAPPSKPTEQRAPEPRTQLASSDHKMQVGTWLVVVVVLAFALAWWFGRPQERAVTPLPQPVDAPNAPVSEAAPESETAPEVTVTGPAAVASLPSPAPAPASGASVTPKPPAAAAPMVAGTPASSAPPATAKAALPALVPAAPRARLVLQTTAESWADVRDANNRLLYETLPAGRTITLEGAAPFSVFLGNADGVRVEFNGRAFDPVPYKRGPTARFTLGGEGH